VAFASSKGENVPIPGSMAAVQLIGHGGPEQLQYRDDVPVPAPKPGFVLIHVLAAGINNTDINTRIGWYSSAADPDAAAGWTGEGLSFPRIQGADVCGIIAAVGEGVDASRIGERVIVQACLVSLRQGAVTPWLGSEIDGGFAQFTCAPAADTHAVRCDLSDAELAAIPCAFGTAENLLSRASLSAGETVLITGASGNVGLAAVQLARLRGARVIAIAAQEKASALEAAGAAQCLPRGASITGALGTNSVDAVIDVVGGPQWPELADVLRPGGRYAVSGAIAGAIVPLDLRKLYLKDLSFFGCTTQTREGFLRLVALATSGALKPLVSQTIPLAEIAMAQEEFLSKRHLGKIVLLPPHVD
jgi:NADPH:quinone reductase-like Zn-dependent oxidoreductase